MVLNIISQVVQNNVYVKGTRYLSTPAGSSAAMPVVNLGSIIRPSRAPLSAKTVVSAAANASSSIKQAIDQFICPEIQCRQWIGHRGRIQHPGDRKTMSVMTEYCFHNAGTVTI